MDAIKYSQINAKRLCEAGVSLAVGTDAGNTGLVHGGSIHHEIRMLNELGMPMNDVIVAATLNSATVAGIDDRAGSIEPNKWADFLVLEKDPLESPDNLQAIQSVVKRGRLFSQEELVVKGDQ